MNINALAKKHEQYVIDMRREFHMYPELSMREERTQKRIMEELQKIGVPCVRLAGTGVLGTITGKSPGKTIALRADIDALEITEKSDIPYKSKTEGVMHACGHDTHAAMLLGAAQILNDIKEELCGTVKLMFQPGEEVAQGAKAMIHDGALDGVNEVFGLHVMGNIPTGKIGLGAGPRMASADVFKLTIKGKGGHGAAPHFCVDAVVAASAVVMNLQSIVSREISPMEAAVVSVGKFNAGTRFNIIADEAVLEGTTRCFSHEVRATLPPAIERIAKSTAAAYRAQAELEYNFFTSPTINDAVSTERVKKSAAKVVAEQDVIEMPISTGSEDFSEYLVKVPGTFAVLGTASEEKDTCYSNHHPQFNIDEDMLQRGAALYAQVAADYLNEDKR